MPRRLLFFLLALITCGAVASCSRRGDVVTNAASDGAAPAAAASSRAASCERITSMSVCSEYSAAYLGQSEAVHAAACRKLGGIFVAAECPNTAVLGTCTMSTGEVRKYYDSGGAPYDAAKAEKECSGTYRGTWAAMR